MTRPPPPPGVCIIAWGVRTPPSRVSNIAWGVGDPPQRCKHIAWGICRPQACGLAWSSCVSHRHATRRARDVARNGAFCAGGRGDGRGRSDSLCAKQSFVHGRVNRAIGIAPTTWPLGLAAGAVGQTSRCCASPASQQEALEVPICSPPSPPH